LSKSTPPTVHNYIEQDSRKYSKILKTMFVGIKVVNFAQLCPTLVVALRHSMLPLL
jgi:hypothetical protein